MAIEISAFSRLSCWKPSPSSRFGKIFRSHKPGKSVMTTDSFSHSSPASVTYEKGIHDKTRIAGEYHLKHDALHESGHVQRAKPHGVQSFEKQMITNDVQVQHMLASRENELQNAIQNLPKRILKDHVHKANGFDSNRSHYTSEMYDQAINRYQALIPRPSPSTREASEKYAKPTELPIRRKPLPPKIVKTHWNALNIIEDQETSTARRFDRLDVAAREQERGLRDLYWQINKQPGNHQEALDFLNNTEGRFDYTEEDYQRAVEWLGAMIPPGNRWS